MRTPVLSESEITDHLTKLPGWTQKGEVLTKRYEFQTFMQSLQFVNRIGETAEAVNHHPDIEIQYNKVILHLTTHDSGGITQNDIELAASADDAADMILE